VHNLLDAGKLPDLDAVWSEMNDAATACYGWPTGTWRNHGEVLRLLVELNEEIARGQW